jgi:hypothetical protein
MSTDAGGKSALSDGLGVTSEVAGQHMLNGVPWAEFETHFQALHELLCRANLIGGASVGGSYKGWLADGRSVMHRFSVSGYERTGPTVERERANRATPNVC